MHHRPACLHDIRDVGGRINYAAGKTRTGFVGKTRTGFVRKRHGMLPTTTSVRRVRTLLLYVCLPWCIGASGRITIDERRTR
jgi:hypothetical protein